jgi:4-alpha-glucanotransferase
MNIPRSAGIILHISSLPSPHGIGDLGPSVYRFADFLQAASVRYWQILPLNYTDEGSGFSPYSGLSAFAGNIFFISPDLLVEDGLLRPDEVEVGQPFPVSPVSFPAMATHKRRLLDSAYQHFTWEASQQLRDEFGQFCHENQSWLEDFALFMALKNHFNGQSWSDWPEEIRKREKKAWQKQKASLAESIEKQAFFQFLFFRQWNRLKAYCAERNISFIGDLPFYVSYDSADVWTYPQYFKLDEQQKPKVMAGVPPDYFSKTGQLWGMPIFDWEMLKKDAYGWWINRIAQNLRMFGLLRLDHFRAFAAYWEVPATEQTAVRGYWVEGKGMDFFPLLQKKFPDLPFIAEDLGEIDQPVHDLIARFQLPGMRVLQFAFYDNMPQSPYAPHHHVAHSVVYTGTHDNNTVAGWYKNGLKATDR